MSQLKVINKEMTSDIKVVISDNNSTDIEGYKNIEKYCTDNNLTYNRNATNSKLYTRQKKRMNVSV
jgi:hypothetical protein